MRFDIQSAPRGRKPGSPRNRKPGTPPFLRDPREERPGEKIGGGWFVFRRTAGTGRIRVPEWPFEHPDLASALAEKERLEAQHPRERFCIGRTYNVESLAQGEQHFGAGGEDAA